MFTYTEKKLKGKTIYHPQYFLKTGRDGHHTKMTMLTF